MTLQIEAGKYYKTRDGRRASWGGEIDDDGDYEVLIDGDWMLYKSDGTHGGYTDFISNKPHLDLIAEWTDTPADDTPKTWGEMTDAEKGALLLGVNRGQEIQYAYADDMIWRGNHNGFTFNDGDHYRIKQQPVVETVTICGGPDDQLLPPWRYSMSGPYAITFNTTNGEPATGTFRNEAGDVITMERINDQS